MLLIVVLCKEMLDFPDALLYGRVFPAVGLSVLVVVGLGRPGVLGVLFGASGVFGDGDVVSLDSFRKT